MQSHQNHEGCDSEGMNRVYLGALGCKAETGRLPPVSVDAAAVAGLPQVVSGETATPSGHRAAVQPLVELPLHSRQGITPK